MNRLEPNEQPRRAPHTGPDVRVDAIKEQLDRLTRLGLPTLTARQALNSLARELFDLRGRKHARDD